MKKIIIALMFLSFSVNSFAANWLNVINSKNGELQIFLDLESVKPYYKSVPLGYNNNYISAFFQYTYLKDHKKRKEGWYYDKTFKIIDCDNKTYFTPSFVVYGLNDQIIDSYDTHYFTANDFNIAYPETIGNGIVEYACTAYDVIYNS